MVGTAANRRSPLLRSWCPGGALVYSVRLESVSSSVEHSDEPPALEIRLSPDPITRFLNNEVAIAIAVSGVTILTIMPNSRDTAILNIVTQSSTPGPQLHDSKLKPVMLPVADDTVIVMDTILRGDGYASFEALHRTPGGSWRTDLLPNPPPVASNLSMDDDEEEEYVSRPNVVDAYFVVGARMWITIYTGNDPGDNDVCTYSLDTHHGTWHMEGSWEVPLHGRSLFVPELDLVFGLSNFPFIDCTNDSKPGCPCHHLCALDVEARPPVVRHMWEFPAERREEVPSWDTVSLAHLGSGRFCIARSVKVEQSALLSPWCNGNGTSFSLVDVTRPSPGPGPGPGPGGELQLTKRGRTHTHQWGWPYENYGNAEFLL